MNANETTNGFQVVAVTTFADGEFELCEGTWGNTLDYAKKLAANLRKQGKLFTHIAIVPCRFRS